MLSSLQAYERSLSAAYRRWVFYICAIVTGTTALLLLRTKESRPSRLLRRHVRRVSQDTGYAHLTESPDAKRPTAREFVRTALRLPAKLFFTEPIVFAISLMSAIVFSLGYLFTAVMGDVYADEFEFTPRQSALLSLTFGIGACFTFPVRYYDLRIVSRRLRRGEVILPEDKLLGFFVAAPLLAIGLWWFAWSVPPLVRTSAWASIPALILFGYSLVEFENVLTAYLTDTYADHAGSANAPLAFLKSLMSAFTPLFGSQLFNLGPNYVLTALASLASVFCMFAVWFKYHGKRIRERSPFAAKTWAVEIDNTRASDRILQGTLEDTLNA